MEEKDTPSCPCSCACHGEGNYKHVKDCCSYPNRIWKDKGWVPTIDPLGPKPAHIVAEIDAEFARLDRIEMQRAREWARSLPDRSRRRRRRLRMHR